MQKAALALIAIIAGLHLYIAWFEIFAWTTKGPEIFTSLAPELFEPTTAIAANQGTYNAFLAAGLIWSLLISDELWRARVATCFLVFVAVAGIVGAATVSTTILFVQTVPAILALFCVHFAQRRAQG
ncbi:MAG: DUF1304 domain-containing protein [Pseudomonadota bacterium]